MTLPVTTDGSLEDGPGRSTFFAVAAVALSLLLYEILLTRVSSLRYHFHFSYLVVSNCLLMFGASGTVLALTRSRWWQAPKAWLSSMALAHAVALGLAWAVVLWLPVHRGPMDSTGILSLLFFNVATAPPFFFGGAFWCAGFAGRHFFAPEFAATFTTEITTEIAAEIAAEHSGSFAGRCSFCHLL